MNQPPAPQIPLVVLSSSRPNERKAWLDTWAKWPEREPAAHPGYLEAIAAEDEQPMCAVLSSPIGGVLFPFLRRRLGSSPTSGIDYTDITGPLFGYTGAFCWNIDRSIAGGFWAAFDAWARTEHVVSTFVRLSLFDDDTLPFEGRSRVAQSNVVRSLQITDEHLWSDVEHKVRKNVTRAQREGVTIDHDPECRDLDDFLAVYLSTMGRRKASDRYLFPRRFFETLTAELGSGLQLFLARVGSTVVSAELLITSTHHAYSFLGGTMSEAFSLRPNDLLKYQMIRCLRDLGFTHYVLGGGPEPGDGIFRYKRSFAPNGIVDFKVGERIHNPEAYDALLAERLVVARRAGLDWHPKPNFFPAYRSP